MDLRSPVHNEVLDWNPIFSSVSENRNCVEVGMQEDRFHFSLPGPGPHRDDNIYKLSPYGIYH